MNAQLAVDLYNSLDERYHWDAQSAWKGIALLLLSCDIWTRRWERFKEVVVYRDSNDFKEGRDGEPNAVLRRAKALTAYLAAELGVETGNLCKEIGLYFRQEQVSRLQPHNLVGHAFRSLTVNALQKFGNPDIAYEEEVDPHAEFPGFEFQTRSKSPRIDIVARKGRNAVALMSLRWRYRHDRVDVVDEAIAYAPAARRCYANCQLFAVVGEFAPNRLQKILTNCPPDHANPALNATVHFATQLITNGLGENGRLRHLKGLDWLIQQTHTW